MADVKREDRERAARVFWPDNPPVDGAPQDGLPDDVRAWVEGTGTLRAPWTSFSRASLHDVAVAMSALRERAEKAEADQRERFHEHALIWRDIEPSEHCKTCSGSGRRVYTSTATWGGGAGGQMMTPDVCDACWGSGSATRPGENLRAYAQQCDWLRRRIETVTREWDAAAERAEKAERERDEARKAFLAEREFVTHDLRPAKEAAERERDKAEQAARMYAERGDEFATKFALAEIERDEARATWPRLAKQQPCGCVVCTCEDDERCHGCGARACGTHPVSAIPDPVWEQHPLTAERDALRAENERLRAALIEARPHVENAHDDRCTANACSHADWFALVDTLTSAPRSPSGIARCVSDEHEPRDAVHLDVGHTGQRYPCCGGDDCFARVPGWHVEPLPVRATLAKEPDHA